MKSFHLPLDHATKVNNTGCVAWDPFYWHKFTEIKTDGLAKIRVAPFKNTLLQVCHRAKSSPGRGEVVDLRATRKSSFFGG